MCVCLMLMQGICGCCAGDPIAQAPGCLWCAPCLCAAAAAVMLPLMLMLMLLLLLPAPQGACLGQGVLPAKGCRRVLMP